MRDLLDPEFCTGGPHPIEHNPSNWKGYPNSPHLQGLEVGKLLTTSKIDANCESSKKCCIIYICK